MYRMTKRGFLRVILLTGSFGFQWLNPLRALSASAVRKEVPFMLPTPNPKGTISVEEAITSRRTVRSFRSTPLSKKDVSQLLFAAQGITEHNGFKRAAPSGGALYPLDIYAVIGDKGVEGLEAGIYHYVPSDHRFALETPGDVRKKVARASLSQRWMAKPPLCLVITAEYARICSKYGQRGVRYAMIEAGHAGQNIFLQAEALGLKAGIVGAFNDNEVIKVLNIPKEHEPLLIMPVGYRD